MLNLSFRGYGLVDLLDPKFWQSDFGYHLGIKLACVVVIFIAITFHDFYFGLKATELWQQRPNDPQVKKLRREAKLNSIPT